MPPNSVQLFMRYSILRIFFFLLVLTLAYYRSSSYKLTNTPTTDYCMAVDYCATSMLIIISCYLCK
ncbi:hypothetical protein GGR55DRAFT_621161 [Xylaria sp. FL0064]|nr:hypothetical protein GGR55DRAFT_621161 [Xylaria sp. FL0064]